MPKKRRTRRTRSSNKGKSNGTFLKFIAFLLVVSSGIAAMAVMKPGGSLDVVNTSVTMYFGSYRYLFPFLLLFLGLLMLRTKFFFSRAHLAVGYLLLFFSLDGFFKAGSIGEQIFTFLSNLLGDMPTNFVLLAGLFVGAVVFFDTTIDDVIQGIVFLFRTVGRFMPRKIFIKDPHAHPSKGKEMVIKGGQKEREEKYDKDEKPLQIPQRPLPEPAMKKDDGIMSDKLVANVVGATGPWEYPVINLLADAIGKKAERGDVKKTASIIEKTLQSFGIEAHVVEVNLGPAVTQYALEIALGTKVSKITSLSNDLALATEAPTGQIRIEAPIPGRSMVGIEIPNRSLELVPLRTMLESQKMRKNKSKLTVSLGLDVSGEPVVADLSRMPHVLIAGTTGSGKSVAVNTFIMSILFRASPEEVKFIMIDPKRVEMTVYNGIPHLLHPVIVETDKILSSLRWAVGEMERRYKVFAERSVRNIESFNEMSGFQAMPYIVILIDELADLMTYAPVEVEEAIARLAQMARATGIHLVVATQRPSVDVITGLIKANIPCRIAFNVSSMTDSRVILDTPGAEKLLGRGDMLFVPPDQAKPTRIQGTFVSEKDVKRVVDFFKERVPEVHYTEEVTQQAIHVNGKRGGSFSGGGGDEGDPLIDQALKIVYDYDKASASLLQRKLSIGYSRAAKILDILEEMSMIGPAEGSKPRDVIKEAIANYMNEKMVE